jgi:DhnA family fructose-bisphosphate aldolase class Ia
MELAKLARMNRIFGHPSGLFCSLAVDHFIGYQDRLPTGLKDLPRLLSLLVPLRPDAVTMWKGLARHAWEPYAGKVPLIVSAVCFTANDAVRTVLTRPAEAVELGADGIAVAIGVRGHHEGEYLHMLARAVEEAAPLHLPVIAHMKTAEHYYNLARASNGTTEPRGGRRKKPARAAALANS